MLVELVVTPSRRLFFSRNRWICWFNVLLYRSTFYRVPCMTALIAFVFFSLHSSSNQSFLRLRPFRIPDVAFSCVDGCLCRTLADIERRFIELTLVRQHCLEFVRLYCGDIWLLLSLQITSWRPSVPYVHGEFWEHFYHHEVLVGVDVSYGESWILTAFCDVVQNFINVSVELSYLFESLY